MHASTAVLLAVAGFAAAQSSVSGCGDSVDLIIESCLGTTGAQLEACDANDWACLCEQSNNVLTCYNNCPTAPDRFGYEQTKVANCNAASAYPSSSATASATASNNASATASPTTTDDRASATGTGSGATASATGGSSAASVAIPAALAAFFGLVAFL